MRYFELLGVLYHCDEIFNWVAVDRDGSIWLYEDKPDVCPVGNYWDADEGDTTFLKSELPEIWYDWKYRLYRLPEVA